MCQKTLSRVSFLCGRIFVFSILVSLLAGCGNAAKGQTYDDSNLLIQVRQESNAEMPSAQSRNALSRFYAELSRLESGEAAHVQILQIGDSHTANDFFSGRLRARFQERFGNSGRGMMPPGVVYNGIHQNGVKPTQSEGWEIANSLKNVNGGPYGISGFVARSTRKNAYMELTVEDNSPAFDWGTVDYIAHPGGGKFQVFLDGILMGTVSTVGSAGHIGHFTASAPSSVHVMKIVALAKDIGITGWATGMRQHGVTLSSHGVVSATAGLFQRWDPETVRTNIANIHPSLIIVAYGTNEAFEPDFNPSAYTQLYADLLGRLQHLAPYASILAVGPPESLKADSGCSSKKTDPASCDWNRPPALDQVREIQRRVTQNMGIDYWNWSEIMPNGIMPWIEGGWARQDHVHFTPPGYAASADYLFDRLMKGYEGSHVRNTPKQPQS